MSKVGCSKMNKDLKEAIRLIYKILDGLRTCYVFPDESFDQLKKLEEIVEKKTEESNET